MPFLDRLKAQPSRDSRLDASAFLSEFEAPTQHELAHLLDMVKERGPSADQRTRKCLACDRVVIETGHREDCAAAPCASDDGPKITKEKEEKVIVGMRLGQFLDVLETIEPSAYIYIAGCPVVMSPGEPDSYRGYYDQLAISVQRASYSVAGDLLKTMKAALDKTFTGYKGGEYRMHLGTPLWLANHGEASGTRVTGIREAIGFWEITWERES